MLPLGITINQRPLADRQNRTGQCGEAESKKTTKSQLSNLPYQSERDIKREIGQTASISFWFQLDGQSRFKRQ